MSTMWRKPEKTNRIEYGESLSSYNGQSATIKGGITYMYIKNKFDYFCQKIKEKYPNEDLTVLEFTESKKPATILCNTCKNTYTLKNGCNFLVPSKKKVCSKCIPREDTIEIGNKVQDILNNTSDLELLNTYTKITDNLELRCKKCGGTFKRMPQVLLKSQKCPRCETFSIFKTKDVFEYQLKEKYGDEYTLLGEYIGTNKETLFRHNDCGFIFKAKPHNLLTKAPCPKCKRFNSKGEIRISKLLKEHNIDFEQQKRFEELSSLSFDFYIKEKNLLIEYQGEQHFHPIKHFGGERKFLKQLDNDNKKKQFCEKNKYKLLEIGYQDYDNIENILSFLWLND